MKPMNVWLSLKPGSLRKLTAPFRNVNGKVGNVERVIQFKQSSNLITRYKIADTVVSAIFVFVNIFKLNSF